ncbi:MAG: CBS domain-containing protein [bacterium]|nr:CBS domain-containing protein [bacterium]
MSLKYTMIEIFTSEEARYNKRPLHEAILDSIRELKIAARCMVTKGTGACYETGEIASQSILTLSYNMPIKIEILLPSAELDEVLPNIKKMVTQGIVTLREPEIISYRTRKSIIPRQVKVKDVMTPSPVTLTPYSTAAEAALLLLSSSFNGIPITDKNNNLLGIVTQGDLIGKAKLPVRPGLLTELGSETVDPLIKSLNTKHLADIMTSRLITITEDELLTRAVEIMISREVKRIPVTSDHGKLTGILSRLDIFKTITRESAHWEAMTRHNMEIENRKFVSHIMRRDIHKVHPETSLEEVIGIIDSNDIQRVAVVDSNDRFLGIISDRDLLSNFSENHTGFREFIGSKLPFKEKKKPDGDQTAADIMQTNLITIDDEAPINEAIRLMTENGLKRLPVVDSEKKFLGMVSRDSVLRESVE